jgi:ABC-type antimicrobial peptide transport system permease subunit
VAANGDPLELAPAVREAVARVDKDQAVTQVRTMEEVAAQTIAQPKFRAGLLASFAGLALGLAAVGIFGLMAFSVSQRTREFGIRRTLGAQTGDLLGLVLWRGLRVAAAGVAAGTLGALALARFLQTLLYGVKPLDPPAFVAAAVALTLVALAACAIPAFRAAGTDPAKALAQE